MKILFCIFHYFYDKFIGLKGMSDQNSCRPPSHRTFNFGSIIIDSDFDSGNCSHAEKINYASVKILVVSTKSGSEQTIPKITIEPGFISRLLVLQPAHV